jgi:hypothetical protein
MKTPFNTYTAYSIGCGIVWALILLATASQASSARFHQVLLVFFGWAIGWLSATIARAVYPPPVVTPSTTGKR